MGGEMVPFGTTFEDDAASLRAENKRLRDELRQAQQDLADTTSDLAQAQVAQASVRELRRLLGPIYRGLQAVFGEIEAAGITAEAEAPRAAPMAAVPSGVDPRVAAVWQAWKEKLGTGPAKIIDALLTHGGLNIQQIAMATGYNRNSVPQYLAVLNKAGLLRTEGGKKYLKTLP